MFLLLHVCCQRSGLGCPFKFDILEMIFRSDEMHGHDNCVTVPSAAVYIIGFVKSGSCPIRPPRGISKLWSLKTGGLS